MCIKLLHFVVLSSHASVHSGFGCVSLIWLKVHSPNSLRDFDCSGTVADFLVTLLCKLGRPLINIHNAISWGYCDAETYTWNVSMYIIFSCLQFCFMTLSLIKIEKIGVSCKITSWNCWLRSCCWSNETPLAFDIRRNYGTLRVWRFSVFSFRKFNRQLGE